MRLRAALRVAGSRERDNGDERQQRDPERGDASKSSRLRLEAELRTRRVMQWRQATKATSRARSKRFDTSSQLKTFQIALMYSGFRFSYCR